MFPLSRRMEGWRRGASAVRAAGSLFPVSSRLPHMLRDDPPPWRQPTPPPATEPPALRGGTAFPIFSHGSVRVHSDTVGWTRYLCVRSRAHSPCVSSYEDRGLIKRPPHSRPQLTVRPPTNHHPIGDQSQTGFSNKVSLPHPFHQVREMEREGEGGGGRTGKGGAVPPPGAGSTPGQHSASLQGPRDTLRGPHTPSAPAGKPPIKGVHTGSSEAPPQPCRQPHVYKYSRLYSRLDISKWA